MLLVRLKLSMTAASDIPAVLLLPSSKTLNPTISTAIPTTITATWLLTATAAVIQLQPCCLKRTSCHTVCKSTITIKALSMCFVTDIEHHTSSALFVPYLVYFGSRDSSCRMCVEKLKLSNPSAPAHAVIMATPQAIALYPPLDLIP